MVVNKIHNYLKAIGLSEYEAKTYTALLQQHPATAYEIAKNSGVPTSKIYEVVSRMEDKGIVMTTGSEKKKTYVPLDPDEFISSQKNQLHYQLDALSRELKLINTEQQVSYIWNIHSYDQLMQKAYEIINEAKATILLSAWNEELEQVYNQLKTREQHNISVSIVHFGKKTEPVGHMFQHPIEDTLYSEKGGRGFLLIADGKTALMGTIFPDERTEGAWSMNSGFVALAEDYLKHDIYIMKIVARFDKQLQKTFGANYEMLRDIFNDQEAE